MTSLSHFVPRSGRLRIVVGCVAICTLISAGLFARQNPQPVARIHGVVLDADSEMQVSGVTVFGRQTGDDGRFALDDVAPGRLVITASKRGYWDQSLRFTVAPGQILEGAVFRIRKEDSGTGVVNGHVFDLQGHPVARAKISIYQFGYSPSPNLAGMTEVRPKLQLVCCAPPRDAGTRTDDRGEFRLYGIAHGHYVVLVGGCRPNSTPISSPGGPSLCSAPFLGASFYPGVTDVSKAAQIEVRAGEETRLDNLTLPPPLGKIQVHLVDEGGETLVSPVNLGDVFFMYAGFMYGGSMLYTPILTESVVPVRGQAEMAVNFTGTYVINAGVTPVPGSPSFQGQTIVEFKGTDVSVTAKLAKVIPGSGGGYRPNDGSMIKGHVTVEASVAGLSSPLVRSALQLLFTSMPSSPELEPTLLVADVQADGSFNIPQIHSGQYRLIGFRPAPSGRNDRTYEDYYIVAARQGKMDVLIGPIEIPLREERDVDVVLRPSGGLLRGTVTDASNRPVQNAVVAIIPEAALSRRVDRKQTYRTERTDQNGVFESRGLPPGSYRIN